MQSLTHNMVRALRHRGVEEAERKPWIDGFVRVKGEMIAVWIDPSDNNERVVIYRQSDGERANAPVRIGSVFLDEGEAEYLREQFALLVAQNPDRWGRVAA